MTQRRYQAIASLLQAIDNCEAGRPPNIEARDSHLARLGELATDCVRGSGFDSGTALDLDKSTPNKLVFLTSFHHMKNGVYDGGWTEHTVTIKPTLQQPGYALTVSGRDRNDIKEYVVEVFSVVLEEEVDR